MITGMAYAVVTQSRGDAPRLAEWVTYHARLGFQEFHVVLDGLVDDSDEVLARLDVGARIVVHHRAESGEYHEALTASEQEARNLGWREANSEQHARNLRWRESNAELLAAVPFRAQDPLSLRQGLNIGPLIEDVVADRKGWVAFFDVDEFIHLQRDGTIPELVKRINAEKKTSRISFLSFNVDTSGHDPSRPVLEQHTLRWSREDVLNHPVEAWARRYKTMARFRAATPYAGVHKITRGPRTIPEPEDARLLHFRMPLQNMHPEIPYPVHDPIPMPPAPEEPTTRRRWPLSRGR